MRKNLFNTYIADLVPKLNWRHFGVGCLQAYLHEGSDYEQRIHLWHNSLVAKGIHGYGDMHDHRFDFTSQILCGFIENRVYHSYQSTAGNYDVYNVVNARKQKEISGKFDGNVELVDRHQVNQKEIQLHTPGKIYEFASREIHVTRFIGPTVTLVTKFNVIKDTPARIFVPCGERLIHAFDESRVINKELVFKDCIESLLK